MSDSKLPRPRPPFALLLATGLLMAGTAAAQSRGLVGKKAPAWELSEWLNLPEGVSSLDVGDFRGKVLYVFCFQSWCPGCHSHGFPALKAVAEHYEDDEDVFFVAIQTVFEGFGTNSASRGLAEVEGYDLAIPVAHDEGDGGASAFMRRYRTGGTPWTIVIGPDGVVRWNGFRIQPKEAVALIDRLRPADAEQPAER